MTKRIAVRSGAVALLALIVGVGVLASRVDPPAPPEVVAAPQVSPERLRALREEALDPPLERLKALHTPKAPPAPGDWLAKYPEEGEGQSVAEWRALPGRRATAERKVIHLVPIGEFVGARARILDATVEFTRRFFGLEVKVLEGVPLQVVPASSWRHRGPGRASQVHAPFLLELLAPRRPADSLAMLGLTTVDLYPDPGWNYVFGLASPDLSTGVWSMHRNGDPEASAEEYRLVLRRTLSTAAHEAGHLLDVYHCSAWECLMNGHNHPQEADARPLEPCPSCLQKLLAATGADASVRFRDLAGFERAQGLEADAAFVDRSLAALAAP